MLYDFSLLCTVGIGLWVGLDLIRGVRRSVELAQLLAFSVTVSLWSGGELLIQLGSGGSDYLFGRRVLYAGACFLPSIWLWIAARAAGARWESSSRLLLLLGGLPPAVFYSCLYWDSSGRFISWHEFEPVVGPWFWAYAIYAWSLVLAGTCYLIALAFRHGSARPLRAAAILAAASAPLAANVVHLISGLEGRDPTPIFLGLGVVLVRFAVIDSGLVSVLPGARPAVIEQLDSGVLVANLHGVVVDANPAAERLLGDNNPLGRSLRGVLDRVRFDSSRAIEVREFPVRGAIGEAGSCALLTDRTEARRAEQQILVAQRLESLGVLSAGIAHEVNNPLAFIRGNLGCLEDLAKRLSETDVVAQLPEPLRDSATDAQDVVADLRDGVDRIARLVRELQSFTHPDDRRERQNVCMRQVAERAASIARVGIATGCIRKRFEPTPMVSGNEGQLVQVVLNLLVNAIQASEGETTIDLELTSERDGVRLSVKDRGSGIPDEILPRVFDPFFTTKGPGEGSGLGLSLSFDLVQQHHGTLEAHNRDAGGAQFDLWLPAIAET
ncbi:MAG: ATP-binding protein [Myxococcota bacterium]